MKMTKEEIDRKTFHIVEEGLQVMPPAHYNAWQTVTDFRAVMVEDQIYCTKLWYEDLLKKLG